MVTHGHVTRTTHHTTQGLYTTTEWAACHVIRLRSNMVTYDHVTYTMNHTDLPGRSRDWDWEPPWLELTVRYDLLTFIIVSLLPRDVNYSINGHAQQTLGTEIRFELQHKQATVVTCLGTWRTLGGGLKEVSQLTPRVITHAMKPWSHAGGVDWRLDYDIDTWGDPWLGVLETTPRWPLGLYHMV